MDGLVQTVFFLLIAWLALKLGKAVWKRAQVREAIRSLVPGQAKVDRISGMSPFVGCGSIRRAFWMARTRSHYCVAWHLPGEAMQELEVTAVFKAFSGRLRRVQRLSRERGSSSSACPKDSL